MRWRLYGSTIDAGNNGNGGGNVGGGEVSSKNQLDLAAIESGADTRTTVMVKNIPNKMSDRDLFSFIGKVCTRRLIFEDGFPEWCVFVYHSGSFTVALVLMMHSCLSHLEVLNLNTHFKSIHTRPLCPSCQLDRHRHIQARHIATPAQGRYPLASHHIAPTTGRMLSPSVREARLFVSMALAPVATVYALLHTSSYSCMSSPHPFKAASPPSSSLPAYGLLLNSPPSSLRHAPPARSRLPPYVP